MFGKASPYFFEREVKLGVCAPTRDFRASQHPPTSVSVPGSGTRARRWPPRARAAVNF